MNLRMSRLLGLGVVAILVVATNVYAVDLLYDFEEDSGWTAVDKLTDDGAQDGALFGNTSIQTSPGIIPWGTQSALFEVPAETANVIQVAGSDQLGENFTLAMHANNLEDVLDLTRIFSNYGGTGSVTSDRILLDYDPSMAILSYGIRAIINGVPVAPMAAPSGITDPGYHHYALTANAGYISLYFDGIEIASDYVGLGYSAAGAPICVGEDANDLVTSVSPEQFVGNVDDILVTDQVLTPTQIASLAGGSSVQSIIGTPSSTYAVNYDFEGDSGTTITDKFTLDGVQDGIVSAKVFVDTDSANAKQGSNSGALMQFDTFSQIGTGITGTDLGSAFTMSAVVNVDGDGYSSETLTRLFSTYGGSGSADGRFIFDFEPDASSYEIAARVLLPNGDSVISSTPFSYSENHTLTAVYDGSAIKIYIDGVEAASGSTSGTIDLGEWELMLGEDVGGGVNEQFIGTMDDVLVLGRALSATEVETLHTSGAAVLMGLVSDDAPGDANKDGKVDGSDVTILAGNWQKGVNDGQIASWEEGDFNGDGKVDGSDVTILAGNWQYGVTAAAASVPEPSTLVMLLALVGGLLLYRRK